MFFLCFNLSGPVEIRNSTTLFIIYNPKSNKRGKDKGRFPLFTVEWAYQYTISYEQIHNRNSNKNLGSIIKIATLLRWLTLSKFFISSVLKSISTWLNEVYLEKSSFSASSYPLSIFKYWNKRYNYSFIR